MEEYWKAGISFEEYLKIAEERVEVPKTAADNEMMEYYKLGLQRMNRTLKTLHFDPLQYETLREKNFQGRILIISEAWCGDASATVPAVVRFFEGYNEVRIFLRDSDPSLINQFLTAGTQSIPKILILNEDFSVKAVWGPRPAFGNELLKKFKTQPDTYPREEFYNDLQVYYAKNRGTDVIDEILKLI